MNLLRDSWEILNIIEAIFNMMEFLIKAQYNKNTHNWIN